MADGHVLTEAERQMHFKAFGVMPREGTRYPDKTAVRIKVVIPSADRNLKRWLTFGHKHCEAGLYDSLVRADGHAHRSWWLYFGTITPDQFRAVDYLKPKGCPMATQLADIAIGQALDVPCSSPHRRE